MAGIVVVERITCGRLALLGAIGTPPARTETNPSHATEQGRHLARSLC